MENLNQQIKRMVVRNLYLEVDPESLSDSDNLLAKFDLDPAMLQGILRGLENEFGITVSEVEFNPGRFSQIKGIVSFVQSKLDALEAERVAVIAEITEAFNDVRRENGVSLYEADVIDGYGSEEEMAAARAKETEDSWQNVPHADIAQFHSALSFLDPKGFRYYIPAYMIWSLNNDGDSLDATLGALRAHEAKRKTWWSERFEIFNVQQSIAIAKFMSYMSRSRKCDQEFAKRAFDKYWAKFLSAETVSPRLKAKERRQQK